MNILEYTTKRTCTKDRYMDLINVHKFAIFKNWSNSIYVNMFFPISEKITKNDIILIRAGTLLYIDAEYVSTHSEKFTKLDNCIVGFIKKEEEFVSINSLFVNNYSRFDEDFIKRRQELIQKIKESK